jgi:divalent metal cation (Fe/Co/Zn/Cd) transporter
MDKKNEIKLFKIAKILSILTIIFNLLEGLVSVYFGYEDKTLALFGFGVDSIIEVISAAGIYNMVKRITNNPEGHRNKFEITSLQITGTSFYLLSGGLLVSIIVNVFNGNKPSTTMAGVIIALISISLMLFLVYGKKYVGKKLNSEPILADANCTRVCVYMSTVLFISSLIYEITGLVFVDSIGAIGIIYLSVKEGKEAFEKAKGKDNCNC